MDESRICESGIGKIRVGEIRVCDFFLRNENLRIENRWKKTEPTYMAGGVGGQMPTENQ